MAAQSDPSLLDLQLRAVTRCLKVFAADCYFVFLSLAVINCIVADICLLSSMSNVTDVTNVTNDQYSRHSAGKAARVKRVGGGEAASKEVEK